MNPKIIYPIPRNQSLFYRRFRFIMRIVFLVAAAACVIVNIFTHGKPWSVIVLWSLWMAWQLFFSPALVEFSIFSHAVRVSLYSIVLLWLIDHFLAPGWAQTVIPIVFFGFLLILFILFWSLNESRDRHLVSILLLGFLSVLTTPYSLHDWPITNWIAFAFQVASFVLFIILIIINRKELRKKMKILFRR